MRPFPSSCVVPSCFPYKYVWLASDLFVSQAEDSPWRSSEGNSRSKSCFLGCDYLGGGSGTCQGRIFPAAASLFSTQCFFKKNLGGLFLQYLSVCHRFLCEPGMSRPEHFAKMWKLSDLNTSRPPRFLPTRQEFDRRISCLCLGFAGVVQPRKRRVFKDDDFVPQAARWAETVSVRHSRCPGGLRTNTLSHATHSQRGVRYGYCYCSLRRVCVGGGLVRILRGRRDLSGIQLFLGTASLICHVVSVDTHLLGHLGFFNRLQHRHALYGCRHSLNDDITRATVVMGVGKRASVCVDGKDCAFALRDSCAGVFTAECDR